MAIALWLISYLKKLIVNPIFLVILLAVVCFCAGWYYKGKSVEKHQLQSDIQQVQQTVVKYEKIHKKYKSVKLDSVADLERVLSYEAGKDSASSGSGISQGKSKP